MAPPPPQPQQQQQQHWQQQQQQQQPWQQPLQQQQQGYNIQHSNQQQQQVRAVIFFRVMIGVCMCTTFLVDAAWRIGWERTTSSRPIDTPRRWSCTHLEPFLARSSRSTECITSKALPCNYLHTACCKPKF